MGGVWNWALRYALPYAQARPCLRATIQKTEVRGPKTSPFVVYMLHVRTAFTVRGLPRRYSDFVMLDSKLRAHFVNRCCPPPSSPLLLLVVLLVCCCC